MDDHRFPSPTVSVGIGGILHQRMSMHPDVSIRQAHAGRLEGCEGKGLERFESRANKRYHKHDLCFPYFVNIPPCNWNEEHHWHPSQAFTVACHLTAYWYILAVHSPDENGSVSPHLCVTKATTSYRMRLHFCHMVEHTLRRYILRSKHAAADIRMFFTHPYLEDPKGYIQIVAGGAGCDVTWQQVDGLGRSQFTTRKNGMSSISNNCTSEGLNWNPVGNSLPHGWYIQMPACIPQLLLRRWPIRLHLNALKVSCWSWCCETSTTARWFLRHGKLCSQRSQARCRSRKNLPGKSSAAWLNC